MKNMKPKLSLNFKHINWKIPILVVIVCFNLILIIFLVVNGSFFQYMGEITLHIGVQEKLQIKKDIRKYTTSII